MHDQSVFFQEVAVEAGAEIAVGQDMIKKVSLFLIKKCFQIGNYYSCIYLYYLVYH